MIAMYKTSDCHVHSNKTVYYKPHQPSMDSDYEKFYIV